MEKNSVLDIIIEFVRAVNNNNSIQTFIGGKEYKICAAKYLLGQIIRQYEIPEDHYYISYEAEKLWNQLSNDDIWKYCYRAIVQCDTNNNLIVKKYKNNEKIPRKQEIKHGDKFIFRDVFHDEHIVPIKVIIENLLSLTDLTYENVEKILDKIYICRILKSEDRNIKQKSNRPFDFQKAKKEVYEPCDITLKCRKEFN